VEAQLKAARAELSASSNNSDNGDGDLSDALGAVADAMLGGGSDSNVDGDMPDRPESLADGTDTDDGDGASTRLSDAQPFEYSEDAMSDEAQDIAARGVSEDQEAKCFAQYERDMDECTAYRSAMGGQRFMNACSQRAFMNYQECRGY
jgi:hypothetical protein